MKAKLVKESIEFNRGGHPLRQMGLGGKSFDTLLPGALLKSKKWFGVTKGGNYGGYHGSYHSWRPDNYAVVTKVTDDGKKKVIHFVKYYDLDRAQRQRDQILSIKNHGQDLDWYGGETRQFIYTTKTQFGNRFDILEGGNPAVNETEFFRDGNVKRNIGIGKRTWENLKPKDILRPKREVKISASQFDKAYHFISPSKSGTTLYPEDYVIVIWAKKQVVATSRNRNPNWVEGLRVKFYVCWGKTEAEEIMSEIDSGEIESYARKPMEGSIQQFEKRFEIL